MLLPVAAVKVEPAGFARAPGGPSLGGGVERPCAVLEGGNGAVPAFPCAGRRRRDDVAVAIGGRGRRLGPRPVDDRQTRQAVEPADRFIVGHVGLRLKRHDVGQGEVGAGLHGVSLSLEVRPW